LLWKRKEGPTFFEGAIRCIEQFRLDQTSASNKNPSLCAQSLSEQAWDSRLPVRPETCLAHSLHSGACVQLTILPDPEASFWLTYALQLDHKDLKQ